MGNPTTVIDARGNATYYTWSGDDITSVRDALGRQTILNGSF
jgi:YD repeat-containing protein